MPMAVSMAEFPSPPLPFEPASQSDKNEQKRRLRDLFTLDRWRSRESPIASPEPKENVPPQTPVRPGFSKHFSRRGLVGIPRQTTFKRQEEEQRKNLTPVAPTVKERREVSKVRQRALSAVPEPPRHARRERSAPENLRDAYPSIAQCIDSNTFARLPEAQHEQLPPPPPPPPQPPSQDGEPHEDEEEEEESEASYDDALDEEIMQELKQKWILNLSMHFRDKSPREKFFLTYAENPDRWKRVTVSCDYRDAPMDSLEHDLQSLHYQKDKSARIYESIRMSLPDIQFYDTVTNLKLETKDDRLHVHVTEDVNEIIPYPPIHLVNHLACHYCKENQSHSYREGKLHFYRESELHFDEHMSGFVYRVHVHGNTWIKKEIPGPDSVDEFLYEINALSELIGSKNVIQLKGLVINEEKTLVKGLLLDYAERGALIDILYDSKEGHIPHVPWERRERWAKQIIQGLSNIHEAGFVQGDFTLSNIVIDEKDEADIIDINRRGCPVGWESPEMVPLVESGQRLSMYIGVKSDLYQLGMVLWALAMEKDEPERAPRPLSLHSAPPEIPQYYRVLTDICLSKKPKERFAAKDLLAMFDEPSIFSALHRQDNVLVSEPTTEIPERTLNRQQDDADTTNASFREKENRYRAINLRLDKLTRQEQDYRFKPRRTSSVEEGFRGRRCSPVRSGSAGIPLDDSPCLSISRKDHLPGSYLRDYSGQMSPSQSEVEEAQIIPISPVGDGEWEDVGADGTPYMVHRDAFDHDDLDGVEKVQHARRGKSVDQWRRNVEHLSNNEHLDHVDSGLGDMDLGDLIAGVGEHANVSSSPRTDPKDVGEGIALDLGSGAEQAKATTGGGIDLLPNHEQSHDMNGGEQRAFSGGYEQNSKHLSGVEVLSEAKTEPRIDDSDARQGNTEDLTIEHDNEHRETGS
ncbi:hypothetical protein ACLMJK_005153 [Lecanora helva]